MQHKSHEEVQREETFKTWLTGLHRRRKVRFSDTVVLIITVFCSLAAKCLSRATCGGLMAFLNRPNEGEHTKAVFYARA